MRWVACACVLGLLCGCEQFGPKRLTGWQDASSPEGWRGKRYCENQQTVSEEFDAVGNDGRIDLWRFYHKGVLLTEERDRNQDDRVDCRAEYSATSGELRAITRDTNFDGQTDLEVTYLGGYRWQEVWDRNQDGTADFVLLFRGPSRLLTELKADPVRVGDLREIVPADLWQEATLDEDRDGRYDSWIRYHKGQPVDRGVDADQDGQVDSWQRTGSAAQPAPPPADPIALPPPPAGESKPGGYTAITTVQPREMPEERPAPAAPEPAAEPPPQEPRRSLGNRMRGIFRRRQAPEAAGTADETTETPPSPEAEAPAPGTSEPRSARRGTSAGAVPAGEMRTDEENLAPEVRVRVRVVPDTVPEARPAPEKSGASSSAPAQEPAPVPAQPFRHPSDSLTE